MSQQQQQTKIKPIIPKKINGFTGETKKSLSNAFEKAKKTNTLGINEGGVKASKKKSKKEKMPSYEKVSKSLKKTMGY